MVLMCVLAGVKLRWNGHDAAISQGENGPILLQQTRRASREYASDRLSCLLQQTELVAIRIGQRCCGIASRRRQRLVLTAAMGTRWCANSPLSCGIGLPERSEGSYGDGSTEQRTGEDLAAGVVAKLDP